MAEVAALLHMRDTHIYRHIYICIHTYTLTQHTRKYTFTLSLSLSLTHTLTHITGSTMVLEGRRQDNGGGSSTVRLGIRVIL